MDAQRRKNEKRSRTGNQDRGGCQSDNGAMRAGRVFRFATRRNRRCFHTLERIGQTASWWQDIWPIASGPEFQNRISKFETTLDKPKCTHLYSR
jgi:hypothetical protein